MNAAAVKVTLVVTAMFAVAYLWRPNSIDLGTVCVGSAICIVSVLVYRARERRLKALA